MGALNDDKIRVFGLSEFSFMNLIKILPSLPITKANSVEAKDGCFIRCLWYRRLMGRSMRQ